MNRKAPSTSLGVKLGRLCIKHDISTSVVASRLGVSRQTVYNWFRGAATPNPALVPAIEQYIADLT